MKKYLKLILISILFTLALVGCTSSKVEVVSRYSDVDKYTKYLKAYNGNADDLEVAYNSDYGSVDIYNNSDEVYIGTDIELYSNNDDSTPIDSAAFTLIRPLTYKFYITDKVNEDSYFKLNNTIFYTLDYEAPIEYRIIKDTNMETSEPYMDVITDQTYTTETLEAIAKREYAIAVLTDELSTDYYYFDNTMSMDETYPDYPDVKSAVYTAKVNYDEKTITLSANDQTTVSTITME